MLLIWILISKNVFDDFESSTDKRERFYDPMDPGLCAVNRVTVNFAFYGIADLLRLIFAFLRIAEYCVMFSFSELRSIVRYFQSRNCEISSDIFLLGFVKYYAIFSYSELQNIAQYISRNCRLSCDIFVLRFADIFSISELRNILPYFRSRNCEMSRIIHVFGIADFGKSSRHCEISRNIYALRIAELRILLPPMARYMASERVGKKMWAGAGELSSSCRGGATDWRGCGDGGLSITTRSLFTGLPDAGIFVSNFAVCGISFRLKYSSFSQFRPFFASIWDS